MTTPSNQHEEREVARIVTMRLAEIAEPVRGSVPDECCQCHETVVIGPAMQREMDRLRIDPEYDAVEVWCSRCVLQEAYEREEMTIPVHLASGSVQEIAQELARRMMNKQDGGPR